MLPGVRDYLEESETWQPDEDNTINEDISRAIETVDSRLLLESLKIFTLT